MAKRPLDPVLVAQRRDLARDYILRAIGQSGQFRYQVDFRTGARIEGYNLLRHCGAIWAAATAPGLDDPRRLDPALSYLLDNLKPYREGAVMIEREKIAKLGGAGLAILALSAYRRRRAGDAAAAACADAIARLIRQIVAMHRGDGRFIHKFNVQTGRVAKFESGYYVGEALYGAADALSDLPQLDSLSGSGPTSLRGFLAAVIGHLGGRDYGVAESSHWMLYALEAASRLDPDPALVDYAGRIVARIIGEPLDEIRRRSTPTACRSEGMLAYLRQVRAHPDRIVRERHASRAAAALQVIEDNLRSQLDFQVIDPRHRWVGGFLGSKDDLSIRIDYVQHNLSALAGYVDLMERAT